jgi:hypothetical protein
VENDYGDSFLESLTTLGQYNDGGAESRELLCTGFASTQHNPEDSGTFHLSPLLIF